MSLNLAATPTPLRVDPEGVVRVGATRVTLDSVVSAFNEGATAEEIGLRYPALALADIYFAIAYYLRHRAEVDSYLRERATRAEDVRQENRSRFDQEGLRERLLARSRS